VNISARTRIAAVAAALALTTLALTGCSGGGGGSASAPPKPINPPVVQTFTDSDLVKILNAANTSLNAGGTVTDIGPLSAQTYKPPKDVYQATIDEGGTFTPAACGELFVKIANDVATIGGNTGAYSAKLTYGGTIISATSSASAVDVSSLTSLVTGDLTALTNQCATAQISIDGTQATFAFTVENASTDADTTWAYRETGSVGGATVGSVAVVGLYGNLLIGYEGFGPSLTVDDGVTAVNAVVAAAKSD
jgi:hypothetical protein